MALLAGGCRKPEAEVADAPLAFYVVSDQQIDGGKLIDTKDLPQLGYIAAKPDLGVTTLEEIYPASGGLGIALRSDDAKKFSSLTEKCIGKRLLIVVGDKPISAPRVMAPIEGGRLLIEFFGDAEFKQTQEDLQKLIR